MLKMIFLKSQKMTIEIDGKCLERDGVFIEVANSKYTGTTFFIAPEAEIDDGMLDIIILNKISRLKLLKVFTSIFDGTHINYPEIEYIKAKSIKVIEEKPGKLIPDGEILGSTPVEIECLHNLKELVLPENKLTSLPPEIGQLKSLEVPFPHLQCGSRVVSWGPRESAVEQA